MKAADHNRNIGRNRNDPGRDTPLSHPPMEATVDNVKQAFDAMVKSIPCPSCGLEFTDYAVTWGDAWLEGRMDCMRELGFQERDGPYKVQCELCGRRSFINYFGKTATLVDNKDR